MPATTSPATSARPPRLRPPRVLAVSSLTVAVLAAACTGGGQPEATSATTSSSTATTSTSPAASSSTSTPTRSASPTTTTTTTRATPSATHTASCAERLAASLTPSQRVGQLLMVGLQPSGSSRALAQQVARDHLGGVIYLGGWQGSGTVRQVSQRLQAATEAGRAATGGVGLLVAADQEGGQVQQLKGAGFSAIPSARTQATLGTTALTQDVRTWSRELTRAGVNINLAPVSDTVPTTLGAGNAPIGRYRRDFVPGDPQANGRYAAAFVRGTLAAGVAPTVKHFPGLGRVTGNTDVTTSGTTDWTTSATDPYLEPFRDGIRAGAPLVMVSSARYPRIDAENRAMFSKAVVTDLLRGRLGFDGVVITDDVGAAKAVAAVPVGERATRFIAAGGDIVLTANAGQAPTMRAAIQARMKASPAFVRQVDASVERVLALKVRLGLASCGG
ncbi:glycoside hydrolase family 3 N-terminal domain-containing protein [Phycicoccus sp. SLBN-51]|uniref:glycoside hydrolase family 3 N-terminal domain-containing protein n=1 Tax=Phycicoccus sp. SLBN-51 TaxID=2768447 RepID=UPI00114D90B6|nr:glycoside hydrolase family 3 N-terminal domain-containing protein [Phycicoccus sp. SLBN-51]